jgi:hypothetical protein
MGLHQRSKVASNSSRELSHCTLSDVKPPLLLLCALLYFKADSPKLEGPELHEKADLVDRMLGEPAARSALLRKMVDALASFKARGSTFDPEAVKIADAARAEAMAERDPMRAWLVHCVEVSGDPEHKVHTESLVHSYKAWITPRLPEGEQDLPEDKVLDRKLRALLTQQDGVEAPGAAIYVNGQRKRGYVGLRLKDGDPNDGSAGL